MSARSLPPVVRPHYSDEEAAIIAGYLIYHRDTLLLALESTTHAEITRPDYPGASGAEYYRHAEAYSRYLLYWIGYETGTNQQWAPENLGQQWPARPSWGVP